MAKVPSRMALSASLAKADLGPAKLIALKFDNEKKSVEEVGINLASEVINEQKGERDKPLEGFGLFGVVKETGVDDAGLFDFHSKFFKYPLYRDEDKAFYKALGQRKMGLKSWNPFAVIGEWRSIMKRLKGKNIATNLKGEGILQGGVIVFDKDGAAKYQYEEDTGSELPVDDILAAVEALKSE